MTEKRYGKKVDDVDDTIIDITEDGNDFAWFLSDDYTDEQVDKVVQRLNELTVENEQLKQRNNRQYEQLGRLYNLIEQKDWGALNDILDDFKKCDEQLQKEWGTYGDVE